MRLTRNRTLDLFHKICKIIYLSCATNFWFEDMKYPAKFMRIYDAISFILEMIVASFIISSWGAFFTQPNLTEKQSADRSLFALSHATLYAVYSSTVYYKEKVRELVKTLALSLKAVCDDEEIETMMIRTTFGYLMALVFMCSSTLFSYGVENGIQALTTNVENRTQIAGATRIIFYIVWWIFAIRVVSVYLIILTSTIAIAHNFKNLCKYFEDLNTIFEVSGSQEEKERRYEDGFKVGIQMHSLTLWCIQQTQQVGGVAFSAQLIMNVWVLIMLMIQMMFTERTLMAVMPIAFMAAAVLVGTAVFVWNAGNVTIEASRLPTAMFHSGWHNCTRKSSVRIRKVVTIAIAQAQKRVLIKGLGFIELSYESYVKIVKTSYSLFSVIY
ncbi:uncharacterized protein LOC125242773 [Leguminivora glycinivorella]|uniref:uncharacterized protein LOC125242773 n=1 Tax=Leguminivora glycinivorella TaxID=1035111 RepID=UPI002010AA3A|nr:uncharacterized protein LOC125242773 [Leguminivora glycinivorella]